VCKDKFEQKNPDVHKNLCSQMQTLLNLASLPRQNFIANRYFTFENFGQPKYLSEEKFRQIPTFPTPDNSTK
jgi:hypothetical protein